MFPACALICVAYARARLRALPPRRTASAYALAATECAEGTSGAAASIEILRGALLSSAAAMKGARPREIVLVDSRASLAAAVRAISCAHALGVDAERSAHSFNGFVCTLQVSTTDTDFIFDVLEPSVRDGLADALRGAFTDASVPKVLHGGGNDVQWLSFDFGLYFNGLVDTSLLSAAVDDALPAGLAKLRAEVLGLPAEEKSCYQRGDWRKRPLPADYLRYAASDSAHLVPLAAALVERADRAKGAPLDAAIKKTAEMATRRYRSKETFNKSKAESSALRAARERGLFALSELEYHAFVSGAHARFSLALARDFSQGDVASDDDLLEAALQAARMAAAKDDLLFEDAYGAAHTALPPTSDAAEISVAIARGLLTKGRGEKLDPGSKSPADAKAERRARVYRTGPSALYDNCELCAPDGLLLARISKKKADWYINEGYGEGIAVYDDERVASSGAGAGARPAPGEPGGPLLRVRMFRPSQGKGHSDDLFYLAPRENVCNICGVSADKATRDGMRLFRLFVCPRIIRAQLPHVAKSFTNHDVLLACSMCKPLADRALLQQLQDMAKELGVQKAQLPVSTVSDDKSDGGENDTEENEIELDADESDADDADNDSRPSVETIRHLRQLTRPLVHRQAPAARTLEIIRLLCEPAALAAARRVAQAPQRVQRIPRPRGKIDAQRLEARKAKQDLAVSAFSASWGDGSIFCGDAATADAAAAAGLDASLVLALYMAPVRPDADSNIKTFDNTAVLIMESVYEGGAAWARAAEFFAPFLPRVVRAPSARGFSGLLFETEDRAAAVVIRFRAAFLRACQPRALPFAWRVEAPVFPESHTRKKKDDDEALAVRKARAAMK